MKAELKFLIIIFLFYFTLSFINFNLFEKSILFSFNILKTMLPALVLVFFFMFILNLFIKKDFFKKNFKNKGLKGWFFSIIGGVLSIGPIYAWYPLLKDAKEDGLNYGFIACFLYAKAIKIPFLPVMIFYFGLKYVLIFVLLILIFSFIQGKIIDQVMKLS